MKRLLLLFALLALPAAAVQTGHAVYRPGLTQARIPLGSEWGYKNASILVPNLSSNLLGLVENNHADWLDRTLDVFKDGEHKKNGGHDDDPNPLSGKAWPWSEAIQNNHGVFAYEGEIFVEEGDEYYFFGRMYTGEALVVNGDTVVWQGEVNSWNMAPKIYGFWTAPKTGWVPFNGWLWTWNGGSGDPQNSEWGLQYNLAGFALEGEEGASAANYGLRFYSQNAYTNVWRRFVDPGNGTFLRTVTGERFTTVESSAAAANGRSFDLAFEKVPTNATLVAFSGAEDGFHDTNRWALASGVLAEIPPGDSTTNVTVELDPSATVLRFRLAHLDASSTNGLDVFEEWTEMVAVTEHPVVRIDAAVPGWTNVVVAGSLESFGIGGSEATVAVEVAAADDASFSAPVAAAVLPDFPSVGDFSVELFGLATNTAYLVRATATNDEHEVGFSAPVAFRTRDPGPPAVSVAATLCALFSADLTATVSDWGGGSWDVENAWIDVSADDSFPAGATQTLPLGALSGAAPVSATATATDLEMAHAYFARARAVNSWGVESVSETISFSTSETPIGFPREATVVAEKGKVTASLAPTFVTEGTDYSVTLRMEGISGERSWNSTKDHPPFVHAQYTSAGTEVVFVYTVSWTYGDLSGVLDPIPGRATAKLADRTIESVPEIDPAIGGVYLRPGDTVEIIPTAGTRVDWHTNAVLSITPTNGVFLLEALEPGAALLYETDLATDKTNNVIGSAIVLPAQDPQGGIYLHRKLNNFTWTDPDEWEMVTPGPQGYPDAPGAIAYVVTPASYSKHDPDFWTVEVPRRITLGGLVVGQLGWIHHGGKEPWSACYWRFTDSDEDEGSLVFNDGNPGATSWIRMAGHSYNTSFVQINVPISMENDLEIDEMNRVQDICPSSGNTNVNSSRERGFYILKPVDVGPYTLRTIRTHSFPYRFGSGGGGMEFRGWISFRNDISGSGTIRLEAATQVGLLGSVGRVKSFTGVWDVANGDLDPRVNAAYGGASLNLAGGSLGNAKEMIVRGSWHRAEKTWNRGAIVRTGFSNPKDITSVWTNDWQNALPPRVTLDGGCLQLYPQGNNASGVRRNLFTITNMTVLSGPMGRFEAKSRGNNTTYPHVCTTITNLFLESDIVVSLDYDAGGTSASNDVFIVNKPAASWTPDEGSSLQFLPFFFANNQREGTSTSIATINEMTVTEQDNVRLVFRDANTGKVTLESPAAEGNGYRRWTMGEELADDAQYYSMQLAQNVTNTFEAGATVRNLAGYVDMRKGAALGRPGADAGATLDFGDQPARIFNGNWGEVGTIGCKLVGSAGLVTGGNGTIALGASAEGVAGGVRVAGGTLEIGVRDGSALHPGRIGGDVRVEAGSRLVLRDTGAISPMSKLYLNDRAWIPSVGHVRLEAGVRAVVKDIFVAGEALPHGWYGSSDSDAQFVDDVHFEGPGMVHAGSFPTMMILK